MVDGGWWVVLVEAKFSVKIRPKLNNIKECLKEFRYRVRGHVCSKIVIFCCTEAGLTSKWGRISPEVYWWHQNQSSYNVRRSATSRDGIKVFCLHTHPYSPIHPFTHSLTKSCMEASTLPKNSLCRPGPLSLVPSPCWYWLCVCEGEGGDGPDQF